MTDPKSPCSRHSMLGTAFVALAVALAGCGAGSAGQVTAGPASTGSGAATATAPSARPGGNSRWTDSLSTKNKVTVSDTSLVARSKVASVKIYATPKATSPAGTLKNPLPSGAQLVFLVQERRADRLRVLLPVRPNGAQGWISASDVTLLQHHYRIAISTGRRTLALYESGSVALRVPVGLGAKSTPTPGGVFYIKELLRPPNPGGAYGPYAFGLSGYSPVLTDFLGGDGEIGIHGTNDSGSIGKSVSHGCIRMSNANITKLATMLPLGVPVQIVS